MSLGCVRKLEYQSRVEPGTFLLWGYRANHYTTRKRHNDNLAKHCVPFITHVYLKAHTATMFDMYCKSQLSIHSTRNHSYREITVFWTHVSVKQKGLVGEVVVQHSRNLLSMSKKVFFYSWFLTTTWNTRYICHLSMYSFLHTVRLLYRNSMCIYVQAYSRNAFTLLFVDAVVTCCKKKVNF